MNISIAMTNDENETMYFDTTEDTIEYDLEGDVMTIINADVAKEINTIICETMMKITMALEIAYMVKEKLNDDTTNDYTNNGVTH